MDDLISRREAIDALGEEPEVWTGSDSELATRFQWRCDKNIIETLPSAQPEIIQCKDCKHYHISFCKIWSRYGTVQTRETGFCYMAERKDNE